MHTELGAIPLRLLELKSHLGMITDQWLNSIPYLQVQLVQYMVSKRVYFVPVL